MGGDKWYHMGGERGTEMEIMGVHRGDMMSGLMEGDEVSGMGGDRSSEMECGGTEMGSMESDMEIK